MMNRLQAAFGRNMRRRFAPAQTLAIALAIASAIAISWARPAAAADETLPPGFKLASIEAQPPSIDLRSRFDYRQLILTATLAGGEKVDVTRMAELNQPAAGVVEISSTGMVRPKADGKGELRFSLAGQSVAIPVTVAGIGADYHVSFVRDVMPTISKIGCNAGTCHGSAQGKNGFKLSLRGYDPATDYLSLTDDLAARRFNRAAPEQSLMLLKPSGGGAARRRRC